MRRVKGSVEETRDGVEERRERGGDAAAKKPGDERAPAGIGRRCGGIPLPPTPSPKLRYDLRKMKAHGLLERIGRACCYRLSDKGTKAVLMFILFHKRVCGPLANSLFHRRPDETLKPASRIESAFHKADRAIQQVLDLLAT